MLRWSTSTLGRIGFYVAAHPWLKAAGYVKVGHSASLESRLDMASFKTCFTPEWQYYTTFECASVEEARLLEQAVLYCLSDRRVPQRELIKTDEESVARTAAMLVGALGISAKQSNPVPPTRSKKATKPSLLLEASTAATPQIERCETLTPYVSLLEEIKATMASMPATIENSDEPLCYADDGEDDDCLDIDYHFPLFRGDVDDGDVLTTLRPYQEEAVQRLKTELDASSKAICQMACRCGKTPVAFKVMQDALAPDSPNGRVLYLVPGLALLRQTARKLYSYGLKGVPLLLVGSDKIPVLVDDAVSFTMTTDPSAIRESILSHKRIVVISTYHSSPLLEDFNVFALTIFDECHRVCGRVSKTAFNTILLTPHPHGRRLFLTATPTYDTPIKMNATELFGGIAYRYYLREGIDSGFVNPFSVRIVLGADMSDMCPYFHEVMQLVDKMLVFCRNIQHAEELYQQLCERPVPTGVEPFAVFIAHSRMGGSGVSGVLGRFVNERRAILFNVRLFQEGVEIPDLNAVFFAAPRYSSRDIIQSICRPLNRLPGKPPSFVFLPAVINTSVAADHPINLEHFATLVPFTDALMDEDPALFEYMIDPQKVAYNISVVGLRALKLTTEELQEFVLPAIRRGVRYSTRDTDRLHRAARMPWKYAFREMQRVVLECGRYPKTNDAWVVGGTSISMNLFYKYAQKGYKLHATGERTYLETYQIRDLESLPKWGQYGVHGPYPWGECMRTLRKHLQSHKSPPPLDVHKGGYIGLDATPFERLSGCLMNVNQSDAKPSMRLPAEKQKELDELCSEFGLQWRKPRDKKGILRPHGTSFVTQSYTQFKSLYERADQLPAFRRYLDVHFPGYPEKHARMETLENLSDGRVPPRYDFSSSSRSGRCRGRKVTRLDEGSRRDPQERTVMCRICRISVLATLWEKHLLERKHIAAQRQLTKSRRSHEVK